MTQLSSQIIFSSFLSFGWKLIDKPPAEALKGAIAAHQRGTLSGQRKEEEVAAEGSDVSDGRLHRSNWATHKGHDGEHVALDDDEEGQDDAQQGATVPTVLLHTATEEGPLTVELKKGAPV